MSCEWPVVRDCYPDLPELTDPPSVEYERALDQRADAEAIAIAVMQSLSGRQFGTCEYTVRPCVSLPNGYPGFGSGAFVVMWVDGRWRNMVCGCGGRCRLGGPRVVHLPSPVSAVVEVQIGDEVLGDDEWMLERDRLYRVGAPWPTQDLGRPLGEEHTWSVTYERGIPVPAGVGRLTGLLACEILTALDNEGRCRLPRTVTTVSRQGVTYRAYDPAVIYANGKTGIAEIDLWLASVNPNHLMMAPSVI